MTVVSDEDVGTNEMMLEKRNYGTPGTTEFQKNMRDATAPLAEKFGDTSQHMVHRVSGGQEGDQKSFEHVQRVITGVTKRVRNQKAHQGLQLGRHLYIAQAGG